MNNNEEIIDTGKNSGFNEKILRGGITLFLIFFSGWTLTTQIGVLLGMNLKTLLFPFLFIMVILGVIYCFVKNRKEFSGPHIRMLLKKDEISPKKLEFSLLLGFLLLIPISLYFSWPLFWGLTVIFLFRVLFLKNLSGLYSLNGDYKNNRIEQFELFVIILLTIIIILCAYTVSRSDLDDAFYVAVSAFSAANPNAPLLASDPMLGEVGFPLIFPSYRFSSFELFSGALAYLFNIPAMDVYYIYLLPLWIIASVAATFLLTKEMMPKHWLLAGVISFLLIFLLGEMHRGHANFSFVRIFQGKAVFLSVIVPTIFYLTNRLLSNKGNYVDIFLLVCCQICSIGFSNFGMLAGPIAGFTALLSNSPLILAKKMNAVALKKGAIAFSILFIPLPYLIDVAIQSQGSHVITSPWHESPSSVWVSVFGEHQQYLMAVLLLLGPLLATDKMMRWRLAVPPLLLFGFFLNPLFSTMISKYITTPPVYWRIVWSFPILVFAAISLCMIFIRSYTQSITYPCRILLTGGIVILTLFALPFHTLRHENIGDIEKFAYWKISDKKLSVAQRAIQLSNSGGRLLASDEIAGIISRFEKHPVLVSARSYQELLEPEIEANAPFKARRILYNFVIGQATEEEQIKLLDALSYLNVTIIVIHRDKLKTDGENILVKGYYSKEEELNDYIFWKKK